MGAGDEDSDGGTTTSREDKVEERTVNLGGHTRANMTQEKDEEHVESPTGSIKAEVE